MSSIAAQSIWEDIYRQEAFEDKHSDKFTHSQITTFVKHREFNGLSETGAVLKVGRKIYIDEPKFMNWFLNQRA